METAAIPAAITFSPHPRAVLRQDENLSLLMPLEKRLEQLMSCGMEQCWQIRFTPELAAMSPDEFFRQLLESDRYEITGICVGENWRFGKNGRGDCDFLAEKCAELRIKFTAVPLVELHGMTISSSAIRLAISEGDLTNAAAMQNRSCRLYGEVCRGYHDATDKLACPTANLKLSGGILPPDGVYIAAVRLDGKRYRAAVNIGYSPTFRRDRQERRTEVHLLDFEGSLYGREIEVELLTYLRPEKTFSNSNELKEQIHMDLTAIQHYFEQEETSYE
jgi:riboflavin kinase/FMN adenylyltransferase